MSPADRENLRLIEEDRRRRESALAILLLGLTAKARKAVLAAIRHGGAWLVALRNVLLGGFGERGGIQFMARGMASSAAAGIRRVGRILGIPLPIDADALVDGYRPAAVRALAAMTGTIGGRVNVSLALSAFEPVTTETAVLRAFQSAGYTPAHPHGAELSAAQAVLPAYAEGMRAAYAEPLALNALTGLHYVSVLDGGTTDICRAYSDVKLPPEHPWWLTHWPQNHFRCRACVLPLRGAFVATENPPEFPQPAPGFGRVPLFVPRAA